jgi:UPF0755 protein
MKRTIQDIAIPFIRRNILWVAPLAALFVLAFSFGVWVFWWPNSFDDPDRRSILVSKGATFSEVLDSLEAKQIIGNRWTVRVAARILGMSSSTHVGKYVFESGISNHSILAHLRDGTSRMLIPVSIPEGARMRSAAGRYARAVDTDSTVFMELCRDTSFLRELGIAADNLEGYLLPDTYNFHWQTTERSVIRKMVGAFTDFYADSLLERQKELRMSTHQIITLASIVEGESKQENERAIIAGIYYNRLKKRMRLEADPTIQYIIPNGPRRLTYRDLDTPSPYNTYRNYGLPPGPVNNPGRRAILAALYPEQHSYLFFVADGSGGHTFTKTFSEHRRAVRDFRRIRRLQQQAAALESSKPSSR